MQPLQFPLWLDPQHPLLPTYLSRSAKPHLPLVPWTHTGLFPLEVVEELPFALGLVHVRWLLLAGLLGHFGSLVGTVVSHGRAGHHWGPQHMLPLPCPLAGGPLPSLWPRDHIVTSWVDLISSRLRAAPARTHR